METNQQTENLEELYKKASIKKITFSKKFLFNDNNITNAIQIANNIKNNKNEIFSDIETLKNYHSQIITKAKMIKEILTYEMLFYNPSDKISTTNELIQICLDQLKQYQGIVGGYTIEDDTWLSIEVDNPRFKLKKSQIGIYNTIKIDDCYDSDLIWFLKKFTIHIRKFIDPNLNLITFDYKLYEDSNNSIGWVLFVCEYNDQFDITDPIESIDSIDPTDPTDLIDNNDFICEIIE